MAMSASSYRLPRCFVPQKYDISIYATPRLDIFYGRVSIYGRMQDASKDIELHARNLSIESVCRRGKTSNEALTVIPHIDRETVVLRSKKVLRGDLCIQIDYQGALGKSMHGLYLAKDGPERAIVSQCEATDARAIFFCQDEPDRKASLRWQICTDPQLTVITNGRPLKTHRVRGRPEIWHVFAPTRKISTYLAALSIGAFDSSPTQQVDGIPCRVLCGKNKVDQTKFAQQVTAEVLPFYHRYFGHPYNYEKLDQVAVPGFDAGAMENVGAIFYRQTLLLMQQSSVSWAGQKRIAEVIAHEIAHQWFGNLVTMAWWDDLWLNEAFATWMAYKACHAWRPDWRMWDDFLSSKQEALAADAKPSTHPIYTPVKTPAEATELFDVITYEKGCAVLRMVEHFMGEAAFRRGIRQYIASFKNANARGADLWAKLSAESDEPVESLMQSWINQPGFPVLRVDVERDATGITLEVQQKRFFSSPKAAKSKEAAKGARWEVPVIVQYAAAAGAPCMEHKFTLTKARQRIRLPQSADCTWVYPNADSAGFYRLQLDDANLSALLGDGLAHLTPGARMALIEDQWALVLAGEIHVDAFFAVLLAFRNERDHAVVRTLVGRLGSLENNIVGDKDLPLLQQFVRALFVEQLAELGFSAAAEEPASRAVRRAQVIYALGDLGRHPQVLAQARLLMQQEMRDPHSVEANLAGTVISLGAQGGDLALLKRFLAIYSKRKKAGATPQLQGRYLGALVAFEKKSVIQAVLALCLGDQIPQEQLRSLLVPLLARRPSQQLAWAFLKRHWAKIGPRVGGMGIARLVEATGALPASEKADVLAFFRAHPVPEATRALQKAMEAMAQRDELRRRESTRAGRWLRQTVPTLRHGPLRPQASELRI
jgi:puromycin-sensitive aminopeptidase